MINPLTRRSAALLVGGALALGGVATPLVAQAASPKAKDVSKLHYTPVPVHSGKGFRVYFTTTKPGSYVIYDSTGQSGGPIQGGTGSVKQSGPHHTGVIGKDVKVAPGTKSATLTLGILFTPKGASSPERLETSLKVVK